VKIARTNEQLIQRFESGVLEADSFHHADHVRLGFAYLSKYPTLQALERFSASLKEFANVHGKATLYNETVTYAYIFLIRERMARSGVNDWEEFAQANPDLLIWKGGVLGCYYREVTLQSELARRIFLFPDKCW
jgi:hypothetical protein